MKLKRIKGGQGNRWKKGDSCVSNALINTHRAAAKGRYFEQLKGESNLTEDAIAAHNTTLVNISDKLTNLSVDEEDVQSGSKTFNTFATNFTTCTVPAFNRFFSKFDMESEHHKRMLAVHAAAQEYITEQGLEENSTSYTCAMMFSLEGVLDSEDDIAATLVLLTKVIRKVPVTLLRNKFTTLIKMLAVVFTRYHASNRHQIITSLIGIMSIILRAQSKEQWDDSSTRELLASMLPYCIDERHKIRKSAQYNVSAILKASSFMIQVDSPNNEIVCDEVNTLVEVKDESKQVTNNNNNNSNIHPGAVPVAQFVESQLSSPTDSDQRKKTLHLLVLLRQIIMAFPRKQLKRVCEWVLSVMQLGDTLVNIHALEALNVMFINNPSSSTLNNKTNLAIINAFTSEQGAVTALGKALVLVPSMNDGALCIKWVETVTSALANYFRLDDSTGTERISIWFQQVAPYWKSDDAAVLEQISSSFDNLLEFSLSKLGPKMSEEPYLSHIKKIVDTVECGKSFQYQPAWEHVYSILGLCFKYLGTHASHILVESLSKLVQNIDQTERPFLEHVAGCAIVGLGPKAVINIIPFQVTGIMAEDEKYFWVLPLLKRFVKKNELMFFNDYFVPLAGKCFLIVDSLNKKGHQNSILTKTYKTIEHQIWAMLPSFATDATDLEVILQNEEFPKLLCTHIKHRDDTRINILAALRNMINSSTGKPTKLEAYSKNYLPVLFNVYRTKPNSTNNNKNAKGEATVANSHRLAAYATIKVYMKIVPKTIFSEILKVIINKLNSDSEKETILDLARTFLPYVNEAQLEIVYQPVLALLNEPVKSVQKATYKLLEETLQALSTFDDEYSITHMTIIAEKLIESISTAIASCRAPRLRCLRHVFLKISSKKWDNFIRQAVGEVIMCCGKKNSDATRKAAFLLLSEMGAAIQRIEECDGEETVRHCLQILFAGLTGPPVLVSNTIFALTSLIYQYKDFLSSDIVELLMSNMTCLLTSNTQEVTEACLSFVKTSLVMIPTVIMSIYIDKLVLTLCQMEENLQRKFRLKTRDIFARMMKKFGADRITALVPENSVTIMKRLRNLRKLEARKKRTKEEQTGGDEVSDDEDYVDRVLPSSMDEILREIDNDDSNDDDEDDILNPNKNKSKVNSKKDAKNKNSNKSEKKKNIKKKMWIKEGEDEIVDLLDPSSAGQSLLSKAPKLPSNIASSKYVGNKVKGKDADATLDFPVDTATGKMIITEDAKGKETSNDLSMDDYDSYMHLRAGAVSGKIKKRKRKSSTGESEDEVDLDMKPQKKLPQTNIPVKKSGPLKRKFNYGSEFKSKKAGGDMMLEGNVEPFAYVPFSKDRLNKRKTAKYAGQLTTLIKGAKKGAAKGSKQNKRNKRLK